MGTTGPPEWATALLDRAFGHPRGLVGRLGGAILARSNAPTELRVVEIAALSSAETVLVVGPGPGVGLRAAGERAALVIGVDPSEAMLRSSGKRCADLVRAGRVRLRPGTAERTGADDGSMDVVLSVNNIPLWADRAAGLAELHRVLRPGGRLVLSNHERWLPVPRLELAAEVADAGFTEVQSWTWDPNGRAGSRACQLRAVRP